MSGSVDSGIARLHSETLDESEGILITPARLKSWENRLERIKTKIHYRDDLRAVAALVELKTEIAATRKGVS